MTYRLSKRYPRSIVGIVSRAFGVTSEDSRNSTILELQSCKYPYQLLGQIARIDKGEKVRIYEDGTLIGESKNIRAFAIEVLDNKQVGVVDSQRDVRYTYVESAQDLEWVAEENY